MSSDDFVDSPILSMLSDLELEPHPHLSWNESALLPATANGVSGSHSMPRPWSGLDLRSDASIPGNSDSSRTLDWSESSLLYSQLLEQEQQYPNHVFSGENQNFSASNFHQVWHEQQQDANRFSDPRFRSSQPLPTDSFAKGTTMAATGASILLQPYNHGQFAYTSSGSFFPESTSSFVQPTSDVHPRVTSSGDRVYAPSQLNYPNESLMPKETIDKELVKFNTKRGFRNLPQMTREELLDSFQRAHAQAYARLEEHDSRSRRNTNKSRGRGRGRSPTQGRNNRNDARLSAPASVAVTDTNRNGQYVPVPSHSNTSTGAPIPFKPGSALTPLQQQAQLNYLTIQNLQLQQEIASVRLQKQMEQPTQAVGNSSFQLTSTLGPVSNTSIPQRSLLPERSQPCDSSHSLISREMFLPQSLYGDANPDHLFRHSIDGSIPLHGHQQVYGSSAHSRTTSFPSAESMPVNYSFPYVHPTNQNNGNIASDPCNSSHGLEPVPSASSPWGHLPSYTSNMDSYGNVSSTRSMAQPPQAFLSMNHPLTHHASMPSLDHLSIDSSASMLNPSYGYDAYTSVPSTSTLLGSQSFPYGMSHVSSPSHEIASRNVSSRSSPAPSVHSILSPLHATSPSSSMGSSVRSYGPAAVTFRDADDCSKVNISYDSSSNAAVGRRRNRSMPPTTEFPAGYFGYPALSPEFQLRQSPLDVVDMRSVSAMSPSSNFSMDEFSSSNARSSQVAETSLQGIEFSPMTVFPKAFSTNATNRSRSSSQIQSMNPPFAPM